MSEMLELALEVEATSSSDNSSTRHWALDHAAWTTAPRTRQPQRVGAKDEGDEVDQATGHRLRMGGSAAVQQAELAFGASTVGQQLLRTPSGNNVTTSTAALQPGSRLVARAAPVPALPHCGLCS